MPGRRLEKTGGVFSEIRSGFFRTENEADDLTSFVAVEWRLSGMLLKAPLAVRGDPTPWFSRLSTGFRAQGDRLIAEKSCSQVCAGRRVWPRGR